MNQDGINFSFNGIHVCLPKMHFSFSTKTTLCYCCYMVFVKTEEGAKLVHNLQST